MKLVYQAYGRQDIIEQVLFSVVTLKSQWPAEKPFPRVAIYSDQPEKVEQFFLGWKDILIEPISAPMIREWRGQIDFVHRVKLKVLEHASLNLDSALIYLDGDTYFAKDPSALFDKISATTSLMHIQEARLDRAPDPLTKKIARFCRKNSFLAQGSMVQIPPQTEMWNAGVIGISPENFSVLERAVALTDEMYARYQKHVMEQLAVSFVLQERTTLIPCHLEVIHYWAAKLDFDQAIHTFLTANPTADQALASLPSFPWPSPIKAKPKKSILKRMRDLFRS